MTYEVAHGLGFVPLLWLVGRLETRAEWWWLAAALSVSAFADTAAHWIAPWVVAAVYPVSQAALIAAVLTSRQDARLVLAVLVAVALMAIPTDGFGASGVLVDTVAAGVVVGIVWPLKALGRLRLALLVMFGGGWLVWLGYLFAPSFEAWAAYQAVRLAGVVLFCWAATSRPPLQIVGAHG